MPAATAPARFRPLPCATPLRRPLRPRRTWFCNARPTRPPTPLASPPLRTVAAQSRSPTATASATPAAGPKLFRARGPRPTPAATAPVPFRLSRFRTSRRPHLQCHPTSSCSARPIPLLTPRARPPPRTVAVPPLFLTATASVTPAVAPTSFSALGPLPTPAATALTPFRLS